MNEETFYQKRSGDWERLAWLCNRAESGLKHLTSPELKEFVRLHRRTSGDLATIRTRSSNEGLALFLNELVGRSYGILYNQPPQKLGALAGKGIENIAIAVRRNFGFVGASAAIFFLSGLVVFILVSIRPDYKPLLAPPGSEALFEHWKSGEGAERDLGQNITAMGFYASNNPLVSIITGAVGAGSMGLVSLYFLWNNGAIIGVLAHEMATVGKLDFLFTSIAPHGVPELSGIILSGAAGLRFGWSILFPGVLSRTESLKRAGPDGLALIIGGVLLCFIAAPIEGFFSFDPRIPQVVKAIVALVEVIGWSVFWSQFGKNSEAAMAKAIE